MPLRSGGNISFKPAYDEKKENLVLSLTSTKERLPKIFPTLYSLIRQKRRPDLIVLWLDKDMDKRSRVISRIEALGISIKYREELGPHTKYYHAFCEYKNDVVITVDDDIIYDEKMTEELHAAHELCPEAVTARRVHKIRFDKDRAPVRYRDWIWEYRDSKEASYDLLATGVGGVLYPPFIMRHECFAKKDFLKYCPHCDDIWLKFCEISCGIKVCAVKGSDFRLDVTAPGTKKSSLAFENVDGGGNDEAVRLCAAYFGMEADLCERILG